MSSGSHRLDRAAGLGARDQLGVGERRHDDRDVDAVRCDLVGKRRRKAHHAELGAHVDDLAGDRDQAGQGGDVDDVAAAAGDHVGQRQLASGDHAVEIDLDRGPDRLLGLLEERTDRHHACVVDQYVDVAVTIGAGLVEEGGERFAVGDVERVPGYLAELGEVGDGRLLDRHVAVADDHPRAAGQQRLGGRVPDAAGGAGDRDGLAPDVVHDAKLYRCQPTAPFGQICESLTSYTWHRVDIESQLFNGRPCAVSQAGKVIGMMDVAIVGIGCRLPGKVHGPDQLWDFLLAHGDGIIEVPADRWSLDRYYDPDPDMPGRMYTRSGGFLQDSLWDFDPEFFGISPREASTMDPQQRLLLEVTQEAMDDAGVPGRVAGRPVGVYVGAFTLDNHVLRHGLMSRWTVDSQTATASTFTMLSNRISFVYDLRGPSMTIDTACSSSLVALHEATQAIARGEIELALVGGVNAMLIPETSVTMCKGRFLAEDGHCKTFDAAADGYARGEGAGILVLKPLADATRDQDQIYAVIRATGVNQDGRTSGITVPNPQAQADLIRRVLSRIRSAPGTDRVRRSARHRNRGWRPIGDGRSRRDPRPSRGSHRRPGRRFDQELHRPPRGGRRRGQRDQGGPHPAPPPAGPAGDTEPTEPGDPFRRAPDCG